MAKFNVGDKVRIIDNDGYYDVPDEDGDPGFTFVGAVGTVIDTSQNQVLLRVPGVHRAFFGIVTNDELFISELAVEHAD